MARNSMYFGTVDRMTWVPCPDFNAGLGTDRWIAAGGFLNGGGFQRQSTVGRKRFSFSWAPQVASEMYEMLGYFDGLHGNGPYYFLDPFAMGTGGNVLPSYIAAPGTAAGTNTAPSFGGTQPIARAHTPNASGYPTTAASYTVAPANGPYKGYKVPVPLGYDLHVGAHGTASGTAAVTVDGTPVTVMGVGDMTRTNTLFTGSGFRTISLAGTGTLTLSGIIAQVVPVGTPFSSGGFVPGLGHSGVRLADNPVVTGYSAALTNASIGVTAEFLETGAWEQ